MPFLKRKISKPKASEAPEGEEKGGESSEEELQVNMRYLAF